MNLVLNSTSLKVTTILTASTSSSDHIAPKKFSLFNDEKVELLTVRAMFYFNDGGTLRVSALRRNVNCQYTSEPPP